MGEFAPNAPFFRRHSQIRFKVDINDIAKSDMEMQATLSHIGYMKKKTTFPNRISEWRRHKGFSQQQLADAVGGHWVTISKLERGVMGLSDEWREKIAAALGVSQWDLVAGAYRLPTVHVAGMIEEGGRVVALDPENSDAFQVSTSLFTSPAYRWLVVAGDALWPWYQDGDRLCLWGVHPNEIDSIFGRVCMVIYEKSDDEQEVAVGVLEGRTTEGRFTISRVGMPALRDVKVVSVEVVAMAVYYLGPDSIHEINEFKALDTAPLYR